MVSVYNCRLYTYIPENIFIFYYFNQAYPRGILDFFSNSGWLMAVYSCNHLFLSRTVPLGILNHLLTGRMYGQPPTYGRKSDGRTRNTYGAQPYEHCLKG